MRNAKKLKKKLRDRIEAGSLTYEDLARELGVAKSTVHNWANEAMTPSPRGTQLLALARVLGVTVDYLLDDAQEVPPRVLSDEERALLSIVWQFIEQGEAGQAIARLMQIGGAKGYKPRPAPPTAAEPARVPPHVRQGGGARRTESPPGNEGHA